MNSVERVKFICKKRKIAISKLEKDLGFSNGYISQLRKGVFPADRLAQIADYLSCSPEFLLYGIEKKPALENENGITDVQKMAIDFIKTLSDEQLERYINMGKAAFGERDN